MKLASPGHQRTSQPPRADRTRVLSRSSVVSYGTHKEVVKAKGPSSFKNQLEALSSMSVVVADTGETALVQKYHPQVRTRTKRPPSSPGTY